MTAAGIYGTSRRKYESETLGKSKFSRANRRAIFEGQRVAGHPKHLLFQLAEE